MLLLSRSTNQFEQFQGEIKKRDKIVLFCYLSSIIFYQTGMSAKRNLPSRNNNEHVQQLQPKKYSQHFLPRPNTINPSKSYLNQKGSSLDAINTKRSILNLDRTEIVFKRDKFFFQSKYNNLSKNDHDFTERKTPGNYTLSPIRKEPINDNLKISLQKYQNLMESNNDMMKNIVKQEILSQLTISHPIFKKLNKDLVESLILIGKIKIYQQDELPSKIDNMIGFILYGRVKVFNKDYKIIIEKGDTFGEHNVFDFQIPLKMRCLENSCFFWLPIKHYCIIRQQSIKNGLKNEFNSLQAILRLCFIKKRYKEALKKLNH